MVSAAVVAVEQGAVLVGHSFLRLGLIKLRNDLPDLRPQTSFPKNLVYFIPFD